jgi:hypothetical protein
MKLFLSALLLISLILISLLPAQAETLAGTVVNQFKTPFPGLTVSLAHPQLGRSSPSVTDPSGRFYFPGVPPTSTPYYLEIYWGSQLIYRNVVKVVGNMQLQPIVLKQ